MSHYIQIILLAYDTVPLTLNLTHACVCTRACTRLTRVKVNNLACIVSVARKFGVRTNARGTLDMHDTNMPLRAHVLPSNTRGTLDVH